jgi:hypothetical protein
LITDHVVSILRIYHLHHHLLIILWVGWSVWEEAGINDSERMHPRNIFECPRPCLL